MVDLQLVSALPLSTLLVGVQIFLDHHLQCHWVEDAVFAIIQTFLWWPSGEGLGFSIWYAVHVWQCDMI